MTHTPAPDTANLDAESKRLEQALVEFIGEAPAGFERFADTRAACYGLDEAHDAQYDARFERLALELFEYQYERVPVYRRWAQAHGRTPASTQHAADVPALPVEALRETRLAAFPESRELARFETSRTTAAAAGVLHLDSLALYDAALERGFLHHVVPDFTTQRPAIRMLLLVPSRQEAPRSSLGYMLHRVRERFGTHASASCVRDGRLDWPLARRHLEESTALEEPLCLLGTAFAFVQLLDACDEQAWSMRLPPGSRLLETGGYKGRTRELTRVHLLAALERRLGIPTTQMVSEYGMTELGSQYYSLSLRRSLLGQSLQERVPADDDAWSAPFWLRPSIVNAESGRCEAPHEAGAPGLLAHHDLANRGSAARLLCADLGRPHGFAFALQGRAPRAELRGCGLALEWAATSDPSNGVGR